MKYDIFVSYSSYDLLIVNKIVDYLENTVDVKLKCFYACRDIPTGVNYARAIVDALDNSRMMIVIFSEDFNKSEHVPLHMLFCGVSCALYQDRIR